MLSCRFIQGSDAKDPFVFYHWQYIDTFVYFSHRMFTLPPVCWTNAAHKHGVSILGEAIAILYHALCIIITLTIHINVAISFSQITIFI